MRDPQFRQQQADSRRAPYVAPVNAPVDELIDPSGRGWVPHMAPVYGGVDARVPLHPARPRPEDPQPALREAFARTARILHEPATAPSPGAAKGMPASAWTGPLPSSN